MANLYYIHQSVKNPQEASIFSDRYTWTILDVLRSAGNEGLSPLKVKQEVEKKLRTSVSSAKIYSILKRLYEMEWVHRSYDSGDKTNHNIVNVEWGGIILNKTYDEILVEKETDYITKRLAPILIEFIEKTMKDLTEDKNSKKWLPKPNNFCKVCQLNHEAEEFMSSVLDQATSEFMDSNEYKQFMIKHYFRQKEEDED